MTTNPRRRPELDATFLVPDAEPVSLGESFRDLYNFSRRRWRTITIVALATMLPALAYALLKERTYTATASFSGGAGPRIGGLAAQLGIAIPSEVGAESPQFYVDLLTSRSILDSIVTTPIMLPTVRGRMRTTLVEFYDPPGSTLAERRARAIRKLRERLSATVGRQTGVVNVSVTTPNAYLSQEVLVRILDAINTFNLQTRQSRAVAERDFIERRLAEARGQLLAAEARLQSFLQENRAFRDAPRLTFENDRLSREVSSRQQVVNELETSYERARLDAIRDTPVITVLDTPQVPPLPDSRGVVTVVIFALLFGIVLGAVVARWQDSRAASSGARRKHPA